MTKIHVAKFGGSLIHDERDFLKIVDVIKRECPSVVVISATKGTTNLLEKIALKSHQGKIDDKKDFVEEFRSRHARIIKNLDLKQDVLEAFKELVTELLEILSNGEDHLMSKWFDQILSIGERTSSLILASQLDEYNLLYAPDYIKTDSKISKAEVLLNESLAASESLKSKVMNGQRFVTQGFIGSQLDNTITTLGREGSDYSATLFGFFLKAEFVTIYTDVAGVYQSDPKKWDFVNVIPKLSYQQAQEMAMRGAKVLFPRTLEPLIENEIPLKVTDLKSVSHTSIGKDQVLVPVFIVKDKVVLFYSPKKEITQEDLNLFGKIQILESHNNWYEVHMEKVPSEDTLGQFFRTLN